MFFGSSDDSSVEQGLERILGSIRSATNLSMKDKNIVTNAINSLTLSQKESLVKIAARVSVTLLVSKVLSFLFSMGKIPAIVLGLGAGLAVSGMFRGGTKTYDGKTYLSGVNSFGIKY